MLTNGKGRGRSPWPLLTILFCLVLALGMGAAAPAFALTLSGTVANDSNGNGVLDASDAPLGGISVTIQPVGGGIQATTTTTSNGTYSFTGLALNTYTVTVGSVSGLVSETPPAVNVVLDMNHGNVNFLFAAPGLIGGRVINDLNGNGIAEPTEPGIPGVAVDLNSINSQGQATLVTTVTTGADGTFFFPLQPAGTYQVVAHPPAGASATGATANVSGTATVLNPSTIQVVLNGSQSAAGLLFAEALPQTVGITGFVLDNTGKPIANVVVEQRDASQNLLNSMLTGANGQYFFSSVAAGATYVIRVVPPAGYSLQQVSPTAPATAAGTSGIQITNFSPNTLYANNNFVLAPSAAVSPVTPGAANAISGEVINDLNGNGVFNAGEPGLAGATLTLVASSGVSYGTMVTSSSGQFTFVNLPAGVYTLTRTNPAGYTSTGVQPGVGGTSLNLNTIQVSVTGTNNLFGGQLFLASATQVTPPAGAASISGSVLQDIDNNGIVDVPPDLPIQGVQILLQTLGGTTVQTTFTDLNGAWAFNNLQPGTYQVVQVVPANFAAIGAFPGLGNFAVNATTIQASVTTGTSGNNNFLDRASAVSPTVGTISGSVIQDLNGNGVIDAGDRPIAGVTIQLFTQLNVFVRQTTTDVNGAYAFTNVPPGFYLVAQQVPAGLTSVATFPGLNGFRINGSTTALSVTVVAGVNSGNNNFLDRGAQQFSSISGSVIQDIDNNGVVNVPPDVPLRGVQILLQNSTGQTLQSFFTDVNGAWTFNNLQPGSYRVVQVVPANFAAIASFPGPGGVSLSASVLQVTLSGGASGNNNFLDRSTVVSPTVGTISGSVVRDVNGNGVIDAGDAPLPGVTVQLFTQLNVPVGQTTTDVNGAYAFTNIPPGFYEVVQVVPAGFVPVTPTTLAVTAVAGANQGNNNFLDRGSSTTGGLNTISGTAIRDLNLNGVPDNEPGLAGMQIVLSNQFGTQLGSVITDSTGSFSFSGVANGTFTLTAFPPAGLTSTNAIPGMGGTRLSASSISVTTTFGITSYPGQLFLAGP